MTTKFNWKIERMSCKTQTSGKDNVVHEIEWICTAKDGGYGTQAFGTVSVEYQPGGAFTPYLELTTQQVWTWIDARLDRSEIESNLQAMIDQQKNSTATALPWL